MVDTVADVLLARLRVWEVRQVFGYPGDGINGLLAAWGRAKYEPQFVQARHGEMAAFEAVGYAKFSGRVGVCAATSGPGAIHLLNGLYDAKLDHVPVVAIVGQTERSAMGASYQQEVDLLSLFKDVCSDYVQMCTVPQQLPNLIDRAIRIALTERAPTCIIFPSDVFDLPYGAPGHTFKQVPSSLGLVQSTQQPDEAAVRQAAEILNAGQKVAVLVGQGARGCVAELTHVADAAFARSLGLAGINIDDPEAIGPAWDQALSARTPTVLDIRCDPDVPPIPPHATFAQAKATASAILHGDEDAWGFVKEGIKTKAQQYLPGRKDER